MKKTIIIFLFIPVIYFGLYGQVYQTRYTEKEPVKVQLVNPPANNSNNVNVSTQNITQRALVTSEPNTKIKVPLEVDLYNYTHLLLVDVNTLAAGNGFRIVPGNDKKNYNLYEERLRSSPLKIMNPAKVDKKRFKKDPMFLREFKDPKYVYLYYTRKMGSGNDDVNTTVLLRDHKNKILYSASHYNIGIPDILYPLIGF